jgi:hypothetical protein
MLTGMFDETSLERNRELDQLCRDLGATTTTVQACHILSEPTMQGIETKGVSEKLAVTNKVCCCVSNLPSPSVTRTHHSDSMPRDFGLESLTRELLATDGIHDPGSLLSLDPTCHARFDKLNLWFEGTDKVRHLWVSQ